MSSMANVRERTESQEQADSEKGSGEVRTSVYHTTSSTRIGVDAPETQFLRGRDDAGF